MKILGIKGITQDLQRKMICSWHKIDRHSMGNLWTLCSVNMKPSQRSALPDSIVVSYLKSTEIKSRMLCPMATRQVEGSYA